ncbi:MAG: arsenate reductase (glutaredoxin) [Paracoccaceae bacterium]
MTVTIWHNPSCGTSRNVLAALRDAGLTPVVVEYLKTGWTADGLRTLFSAAGITARAALRVKGTDAEDRGLTDPGVTEAALIAAMVAHPVLVNRPFVQTPLGTALCRPSETVQALIARKD